MAKPVVTLEVLPAAYGDSLLVTSTGPAGIWRMLIDTGTDECWPSLKSRLARLPAGKDHHRHIDLLVITHVDHDHIGAASALLSDTDLDLTFGDIWFNAPSMPASRSAAEGQFLAKLLAGENVPLPWNRAWHGKHAVTGGAGGFVEMPVAKGQPRITLLSPTPDSLATMFKVWDAEVGRARDAGMTSPEPVGSRGAMDLTTLARSVTLEDHAPANGSSIAFLWEHQGASILFGADLHPAIGVPALKALAAHRRMAGPIKVDVFKVSHHGSKANVTNELMQCVQAKHYVISTNGAIFGHPNDEAMARLIVSSGGNPKLWFNYKTERTTKWGSQTLQQTHGYSVVYSDDPSHGVVLTLG